MADKTNVRLKNILSYTHGADRYKGIDSGSISITKGRLVAKKDEGEFYPTGSNRLGMADFPVTITVQAESYEYALNLLNAAKADAVLVAEGDDGSNYDITITDLEYDTTQENLQRDEHGTFSITGKAHADAASPTVLPITIAAA